MRDMTIGELKQLRLDLRWFCETLEKLAELASTSHEAVASRDAFISADAVQSFLSWLIDDARTTEEDRLLIDALVRTARSHAKFAKKVGDVDAYIKRFGRVSFGDE